MKLLCYLFHKWKTQKRTSYHPNPTRDCLRCGKQELYVYSIGWMDLKESEKYEPE
jgi:hypothetical protein